MSKGLSLIGDDCLRENAKYVLDVYEIVYREHVISSQVSDRTLRRVLANNPALDQQDPGSVVQLTVDIHIVKSIYLGQDPYGNKSVVPEKLTGKDY